MSPLILKNVNGDFYFNQFKNYKIKYSIKG